VGTSGAMDTSNSNVKYHITINQNSQSVSNNTSNVSVFVNFWRTNTGYTTYGSGTVYCKINGTTYSASVSPSQKITSIGIDLFSKTLDIGHNSDGTKTLATSAWISNDAPLSSSEQSYSQTLTTIPRASSISSISGGTLGSSVTVNISRASSSFTHTVKYQRSDGQQFTVGTGVAISCTFTPSINDSNYLPNATSGTAKIYVDTYSGGTFIGSKSRNFTVYVPSSIIPTISSVTLSETVAGITAKFGGYVQGKSKIQGVVSASGAYSSKISAYTSTTNSQTLTTSTFTTNELVNSGSQSVSTKVRDSRGRNSSTTTTNYTVLAYTNPAITTFTAIRANSGGVADDQGTYVLCTINASISAVNNLNDKSFKIKYKKKSDSTYTSITITPSGTTYTYNTTYLVASIDVDYEYDFRLELIDYFSTVISDQSIPTAFTLMDFNQGGRGLAFGKVSATDGLELAMPTIVSENITTEGLIIPNGGFENIILTSNTDFNDLITPNNYAGDIKSYTHINTPPVTGGTFSLEVASAGNSGQIMQKFSYCSKSVTTIYQRAYYSGSWGNWLISTGGGQLLYNNSSGTQSTVTLSDTSANYDYLNIYFRQDDNAQGFSRVYAPDGKLAIFCLYNYASGTMYWKMAQVSISGTSITWVANRTGWAYGSSTLTVTSDNKIWIVRVEGYNR
jgi:hypothetical protein